MDALFAVLAAFTVVGAVVTKTVDLIRNLVDKADTFPKWVWNVAAFAVGVAYALGWSVNLAPAVVGLVPALAGHTSSLQGTSGELLTGVLAGGFAGFLHELMDVLSGVASRAHAQAG